MNVDLREASQIDAPHVDQLISSMKEEVGHCKYFQSELTASYFLGPEPPLLPNDIIAENSLCLVAESSNLIVGVLACKGGSYLATKHIITIAVYVDQKWRNCGVGGQFLDKAIAWAKNKPDLRRAQVQIPSKNHAAIALFKKFGFELEGTLRQSVMANNDIMDDSLIMALLLK